MEGVDPKFLWGEIPDTREEEKVPKEIADLIILSAIKMEAPKAKQPQPQPGTGNEIIIGPEHSTMEENVLYTIKLIRHSRQVSELINHAKSSNLKDEGTSGDIKTCPPMPFKSESIRDKPNKGTYPLRHIERRDTPFTLGEPIYLPDLGKAITKEILYKCVATICAHVGFDTAMQIPLQTLTDVAESFLQKFTILLRCAVDKEVQYGKAGFPDAMERVFHEMGFGSMTSLHDFYQKRVLQYRDKCEARSLSLVQQYQALLPTLRTETEGKVRFHSDMESEEEIPELHFPATADGDCEDELQSSLEPGFQMLQSLEQEVGIKYGK